MQTKAVFLKLTNKQPNKQTKVHKLQLHIKSGGARRRWEKNEAFFRINFVETKNKIKFPIDEKEKMKITYKMHINVLIFFSNPVILLFVSFFRFFVHIWCCFRVGLLEVHEPGLLKSS